MRPTLLSLLLLLSLAAVGAGPALAQETDDDRRERLVRMIEQAVQDDLGRERGLDRSPEPETVAEAAVQKDLRMILRSRRLTVNFDKSPILECLDFLRDVTGMNIVVTKAAVEEIQKKTVSLRLKNVTFRNILELMLPMGSPDLRYGIRNGVLMLGLKDEWAEDTLKLVLYDVAELVHEPPDFPAPEAGLDKNGVTFKR